MDALRRLDRPGARLAALGALLLALPPLLAAWRGAAGIDGWGSGDWLISYAGAWTRRGLGGSLLMPLARTLGIAPSSLVFGLKAILILTLHGAAALLLLRPAPPLLPTLALLSPAALAFGSLAPLAVGRKEALLLALFALGVLRAVKGRALPGPWALAALTLLLGLLHEGLLFFVPLALLGLRLAHGADARPLRELALPLGTALLLLVLCATASPLDPAQRLALAGAIDPANPGPWNSGAIEALGWDRHEAWRQLLEQASAGSLPRLALAFLLGLGPCWLWLRARAEKSSTLTLLTLALALQAPLFALSLDWGRWVSIDALMFALACLGAALRKKAKATQPDARWRWAFLAAVLLLLAAWRLPHCCVDGARPGIVLGRLLR